MEQEDDMFPPFWLQTSDHSPRQANRGRRLARSSSSVFFSSGAFVFALLAIALVFIFFIIPSLSSFTSQIFKPHLVKKSWDSLNLVLVLFAIVCGFLGRNGSQENSISSPSAYDQAHHQTAFNAPIAAQEIQKSNPSTPRHQWYDHDGYSDRTAYINQSANNTMHRGVRASSSYPDLRQQEASWVAGDDRWRFYDDTHVASFRDLGSEQLRHQHRRHRSWHEEPVHLPVQEEAEHVRTKNIPVDTFVNRTQIPAAQSDSPPSLRSPSPPSQPGKVKRTYQAVGEKEKSVTNDNLEVEKKLPPPPSPPPLPPRLKDVESKRAAGKNVKKRGVATTKEFLITSLRRKKKKQRQKSVENFETLLGSTSSASYSSFLTPPSPPPPPPPLPPPPSVFHNLFSSKKSSKPKKTIHSIQQPPPPPSAAITARLSKTNAQIRPTMTTQKPPLPVRVTNFNNADDENSNSGGESPLVRIPRPPPLPPFRMPEMKFVVHGDFVRIKSNNSSRSGSPDLDDDDQDSISSPTMEGGGPSGTPPSESGESPKAAMFCPSPDVDTKAETFIARVRAGLRLEKMNSVKEKQGRMSNLGPGSRAGEGSSY